MPCFWSPKIASVARDAYCSGIRRAATLGSQSCHRLAAKSACRRRSPIGVHSNVPYSRSFSAQVAVDSSPRHTYSYLPPPPIPLDRIVFIPQRRTPSRPVAKPDPPTPPPTPPPSPPSAAHMSRMAAQSIRLCTAQKAFGDAFYIFHSVRYSNDPSFSPSSKEISSFGHDLPRYADVAIEFGQAVKPRLPAHALLHSLLRAGQPELAYKFSIKMMDAGIHFHHRSLEAVIKHLTPLPNESPVRHYVRAVARQYNPAVFLSLGSAQFTNNPGADLAVRLLDAARRSHHRRTEGMFQHLMKLCLLHGEIIIATMLFATLCSDWKTTRLLTAQVNDMLLPEEIEPTAEAKERDRKRYEHLSGEGLRPHRAQLHDILTVVDTTLAREDTEAGFESTLKGALQALVNLAYLLDHRAIPYADLGMLIRTIYRCPRVQVDAWIPDPGGKQGHRRVDAYNYCHDVLNRLLNKLPVRRRQDLTPAPAGHHPPVQYSRRAIEDTMVPLSLRSCNALLHYALRHRMSLKEAERVLDYMVRQTGHKPDTATLNILLRSATLLRRSDIAEQVMQMFRHHDGSQTILNGLPREGQSTGTERGKRKRGRLEPAPSVASKGKFSKALAGLETDNVSLPLSPARMDKHTFTAWVTHLTSTGHPHAIADALFDILPQLYLVDHPAGYPQLEHLLRASSRTRERDLLRVASYGPYVFVCLLNALVKAGRTGLAERVWLLAKQAERASWLPQGSGRGAVRPWCLPIHAYTLMLQCYGAEARRYALTRTRDTHTNVVDWAPRAKGAVSGWRQYIRGKSVARSLNGREAARLLYTSMFAGARDVYGQLQELREISGHTRHVRMPVPDARFFNAALDTFLRPEHTGRRVVRGQTASMSAFKARSQLLAAMRRWEKYQEAPGVWSEQLQQVVEDMQDAGYAIPPGIRPMLVGRMPVKTLIWDGRVHAHGTRTPYAFPRRRKAYKYEAHRIPVVKTRGLPLGRSPTGRRRRTGQRSA
ncbi:hypothetical protein BD626DRAFT_425666 [Schizophyllum amplum]|uniref:Uncharacterized protein n=1 Tax=Schizophyllum amplum TaxID=97359 RepID=A0A550CV46_9AGAR|nr:hypothetical protein BD626DRAFT_425666 [Auriculariopsis ampla]